MIKKMLFTIGIVLLLQSCFCPEGDCYTEREDVTSAYKPVIIDRTIFESTVQLITSRTAIENSGKIYVKDNLLFINEKRKGFHVYDNSNPENPISVNYINIPGSTDLAIRNNVLYINQATDLIAAEYDFETKKFTITKRIKNTFPKLRSPDGFYPYDLAEDKIVTDWVLKK